MRKVVFALCAVLLGTLGCAALHPGRAFAADYPAWIGTVQITDDNREHLEAALGLANGRIAYTPRH